MGVVGKTTTREGDMGGNDKRKERKKRIGMMQDKLRKKRSGKTKRRGRDVIIMCGDSVKKEGV